MVMEITGNRDILGLSLDSKLLTSKSQESNSPTNFLDYLLMSSEGTTSNKWNNDKCLF